jgi:hypothetical protein
VPGFIFIILLSLVGRVIGAFLDGPRGLHEKENVFLENRGCSRTVAVFILLE